MQRSATSTFFTLLLSFVMAWAQPGQLAIPRVELMPNQPAPYNVRDWKAVAVAYDAFVYDLNKTGQYLPLSHLNAAGVNYPQMETFRLHTYVGTNSPFGNESINVLPSLVGATLAGVDKSNHLGRNWVLMAQDFYNKANGENLYLNNAGASSGGDWWYDMMPNVYFYQLYALYPDMGGEAGLQFNTIAGRFLEAVRAMGGNDAPWQPAYMNYRAWKFSTMEPNDNGVPEPEAAGAFAWVLYNAWKESGNPDYLKGAEWSVEFLNEWATNPSYELQLPYGTLTAARMNAELGTEYDIEKMVNWSFDRGPLRGWGTVVGNWGGFDVSGLVGEANDAGNDYAFQMNGVQQAAALAPMVRYDKRYARAIGKWMLNLANATRLFFPGFLPSNLQDASAWSSANDPGQVIGYEALRESWQGSSPFSTGDAVNGGWAATNLALYGTASIGYLGALVEKTDVDKILKIDLLATDFFRDEAYPSYLFYNAHNIAKSVSFEAGLVPVDIYDALSESFIVENATGIVSLNIPANEAILVVACPAGGAITYEKNKMLVDGVVVDYRQSAVPYTLTPRIKALAAADNPLETGSTTTLYCTVSDEAAGPFTYQWSATQGSISGTGSEVEYTAPAAAAAVEIQCIATDGAGAADTASLLISVVPEINLPPQVIGITKSKPFVGPGETAQLSCQATDPNGGPLSYNWAVSGGAITGTGSTVEWTAPLAEGIYAVSVTITDDGGLSATATAALLVKIFGSTSGSIIADYPFSGNANDVSGNNLHGQPNGALLTADRFGNPQSAYYFYGGPQHIAVPNSPILNFQESITASCWFSAGGLPDKETFLLSHGSWQNRWKLSITPDKLLRWTVNTLSGIADLDATVALQVDSFYHVAATYDGSLLALYINGELHSYKALSGLMRTTAVPFLMGQMLPGETNYNFKGVMDEVKLYDYALNPDAVKTLYETGTVRTEERAGAAPLVLYPNPATEMLTIALPEQAGALTGIRAYNLTGQLVLQERTYSTEPVTIETNNWKTGVYTIIGITKNGSFSSWFVKM